MEQLKAELLYLKSKESNVSNRYIQRLQQILDKGHMTFEDFIDTGKFHELHSIEHLGNFDKDCKDLIIYVGGFGIQSLKTNEYLVVLDKEFRSSELKEIERVLWNERVNKFFNN